MENKDEIKKLIKENENLKQEIELQKNSYKQISMELGQNIFKNEDLEKEIYLLKKENQRLEEENKELRKFKEEIESSTSWKVKSLFK